MTAPMTVTCFTYESREPLMFDDNRTDAQITDLDSDPTPAAYRAASEAAFQLFLAEQEARKFPLAMSDLIVDPVDSQEPAGDLIGVFEREYFTFAMPDQGGESCVLQVQVERTFRTAEGIYLNAHLAHPRTARKGYQYVNGSDVSLEFADDQNPEFGSVVPGSPTTLAEAVAAFADELADEHGCVLPAEFIQSILDRSAIVSSSVKQSFSFSFDPTVAEQSSQQDEDSDYNDHDSVDDDEDDFDPNYCEQCGEYLSSALSGTFYPAVAGYAASVAYEPPTGCFSGGEVRGAATQHAEDIVRDASWYRGQDAGLDQFVELVAGNPELSR